MRQKLENDPLVKLRYLYQAYLTFIAVCVVHCAVLAETDVSTSRPPRGSPSQRRYMG